MTEKKEDKNINGTEIKNLEEDKNMENKTKVNKLIPVIIALVIIVLGLVAFIIVKEVNNSGGSGSITQEEAKSIALQDAGVQENDVTFTKTSRERDDGQEIYEIDFYTDSAEYDYEVVADTGRIYSRDIEQYAAAPQDTGANAADQNQNTEQNNAAQNTQNDATVDNSQTSGSSNAANVIGVDKAKNIALKAAGVSAGDAQFIKAGLDYDDGRQIYDVEFHTGDREYDFEIDAVNGGIIDRSEERWPDY